MSETEISAARRSGDLQKGREKRERLHSKEAWTQKRRREGGDGAETAL